MAKKPQPEPEAPEAPEDFDLTKQSVEFLDQFVTWCYLVNPHPAVVIHEDDFWWNPDDHPLPDHGTNTEAEKLP